MKYWCRSRNIVEDITYNETVHDLYKHYAFSLNGLGYRCLNCKRGSSTLGYCLMLSMVCIVLSSPR